MANFKRTYINADEELVIQGKLTIEGQLEQKEFVELSSFSQTNFDGDVLVVNADGFTKDVSPVATNSELKLRSGDANASLLFNSIAGTLTLSTTPAIATTLIVSGDISATDITSSGTITGSLTGNADTATTATTLATGRVFTVSGDITGSGGSFNGSTNIDIVTEIAAGKVGTTELADTSVTSAKLTGITTSHIPEGTNQYLTTARVRAAINGVDAGGDGSFAYNSTTGIFTYSGITDAEVRGKVSAVDASGNSVIAYNNTTGVFTLTPSNLVSTLTSDNIAQGTTNLYATTANTRTDIDNYLVGGTGITVASGDISITNSGVTAASYGTATQVPAFTVNAQGQLTTATNTTIAIPSTAVTDFNEAVGDRIDATVVAGTGITKVYNDGADTYTLSTTDADIVHDNLSGFVANEHIDHTAVSVTAGTGLSGGGTIAATRTLSIDNTVATLTGTQTLTNKTLTSPVISNITGNSQITGDLNVTGDMTIVGNLNSATQTDSFITTKVLSLNVGGGSTADASRVEVDRTGAGSNVYLRWNETSDRWMFSNNGSTNNNMLVETDVEGFFSANDAGGDGSFSYNNAGVFTYTGPSAAEARAHISVTDAGGDGSLAYNSGTGVITYTGPSLAEVQARIDNSASNVRAHLSAGTGITYSSGAISVGTQPTILNFAQGYVKFDANSIGIGPSAGSFNASEANSIAIGNLAGSNTQQSGSTAIGVEAGKTGQLDTGVALGYKAGWNNQGGRTIAGGDSGGIGSAVAIGSLAGYTNQGQYAVSIGESAGLVQQQEHSIAIGRKAGNLAQSAYSIAIGVEAGKTTQGDYSIAIGHKAGETTQASDSIVLRAGDSTFPYPAAATAGATYITPLRNTTADTGKVVMYNDSTYEVSRVPSTVFVSSTANQTITGTKTFSDGLIVPASATATNGAIYVDNSTTKAYVYVNGVVKEITPAIDAGDVEDVGASGTNLYAGSRASGSTTIHGIKSLAGGTGVTLAETGNVVTVTTDAFRSDANVRALFSAVDSAGDGTFSYNSSTGQFTYSGISDSQVRGKLSGTGLIGYNTSTGVISTTADNYSSFSVETDSGSGSREAISSGEILTFVGGTNTTVTNTGNTITIRNDNAADIEAVTAGSGMTGGGSSGALTLNVIGGSGITANADDIQVDSTVIRTTGGQTIAGTTRINSLGINGAFSFPTADGTANYVLKTDGSGTVSWASVTSIGGTITSVTAGAGLTGGGSAGAVTLNVVGGSGITANANDIAVDNSHIRSLFSASGDISYNSSTGAFSFTNDAGDIEGVTAGTGLSGGGTSGTVTLNVSGLTTSEIAAGSLQLGSEAFADSDSVLMTAAAVQDKILSYGYTTETGDITGVTAGTGLSGGGSSGTVSLAVSGLTTSEIAAGSLQLGSESFVDSDSVLMTSAAVQDKILSYGYTTDIDTNTTYTAGTDLSLSGTTFNVSSATANTAGTIVKRDGSGNFSAGTITANLVGTASGVTFTNASTNADLRIIFGNAAGLECDAHGDLTFNPSTNILKVNGTAEITTVTGNLVGDVTGTADKAERVTVTAAGDVNQNLLLVLTGPDTGTNSNAPLYKHSPVYYNPDSDTLNVTNLSGTSSSAKYADLAERYEADADYEPGTVVVLGGEKEITVTDQMNSTKVAGVISTDPAYLMNAEANGLPVALRGRAPVKVVGVVQKGDVLITSTTSGFAMAAAHPHNVSASEMIGKALQSKADSGEGVIEALI